MLPSASSLMALLSLLFSLSLLPLTTSNPDLIPLLTLKASLDPDNRLLTSWSASSDPCSFEGVACNADNMVANISLQGKGLTGSISPAVAELQSLSGLYLHYNALTGVIPEEIAELTELTDLYLNVNNLSGEVPARIGNMGRLEVLQLGYNHLTGSIPPQLGLLKKLSVLALQSNNLTGAIPATLGDLSQLKRLDLSSNHLFGSIPERLAQLPQLAVLDIRNNTLSGDVPSDLKRLNEGFQYRNNTGLCGVGFRLVSTCTSANILNPNRPEPFRPESTDRKPEQIPQSANITIPCSATDCPDSTNSFTMAITVAIVAVAVGGMVCGLLAFVWYRRQKQKIGSAAEFSDSRLSTDHSNELYRKSASPLINLEYSNGWDPLSDGKSGTGFSHEESESHKFNLEEIECATEYFSEANLLGKSSFASTYKGFLRDGKVVAVKSINKSSCKSEEADFWKGLKIMTMLRHENLVGLRGFCCSRGRGECFLVYDFISNGSLLDYLDVKDNEKGKVLEWGTRVSIIKGIARGIEYLHTSRARKPSLFHQNISAEKVFLTDHFAPRLSGAGLHKLLADDVIFSSLKASAAMGYLAPEYITTGRFTDKSDVYAFGVLVFQILSGKTRVDQLRLSAESGNLEGLIDEKLDGNFSKQEAARLVGVALVCTSETWSQRPTMEVVLQQLNGSC